MAAYIRKKYTPFSVAAPWPLEQVDNFRGKLLSALPPSNISLCGGNDIYVKALPDSTDRLAIVINVHGDVTRYRLLTEAAFEELEDILNDVPGLGYEYHSALSKHSDRLAYFCSDSFTVDRNRAEYLEKVYGRHARY